MRPADSATWLARGVFGGVLCVPSLAAEIVQNGVSHTFSALGLWNCVANVPLGRSFYMLAAALTAPYSVSNDATIDQLSDKEARVSLQLSPWTKNPFNSLHAVALTNAGEFASGILLVGLMQQMQLDRSATLHLRGIVTKIDSVYHKKARGKIVARAEAPALPTSEGKHDLAAVTDLRNSDGDLVAEITVHWVINATKKK